MTRNQATLVILFSLLPLSAVGSAESRGKPAGPGAPSRKCVAGAACGECEPRTPILESGRPPLPGEDGSGVQSCAVINTSAEWGAYCSENVVPDCPALDDTFFARHTVFAIAIDTLTSRPCEGSSDPAWALDCAGSSGAVRVVKERPGEWCLCSAAPQHLQRLFLASAVPKTRVKNCRACEETHTIDCLR